MRMIAFTHALAFAQSIVIFAVAMTFAPSAAAEPKFEAHDFSGDWDRTTPIVTFGNVPGARRSPVNLPLPDVGPTENAPFTDIGKAMYGANHPGYGPSKVMQSNDPLGRCEPMGLARNLNVEIIVPHATFEMVQLPDRIFQFFEYRHDWREIWMDGRALPKLDDTYPKWNGYSVGRLEGDTLVVESIGFDDRSWLDKYGYPHSEEMHLVERYRRLDANTLELTMTLTDPLVYSGPWQSDTKIYKLNREKRADWDEQIYCIPAEEFRFQKDSEKGNTIN